MKELRRQLVFTGGFLLLHVSMSLLGQESPKPPAAEAEQIDRTLQLQVLLDRAGYSPGQIDGRPGANTDRAIDAFTREHALDAGAGDDALLEALGAGRTPILATYTITNEDAAGPFVESIPDDIMEQSTLPSLGYTSLAELLGERFHAAPELIARLNPRVELAAGREIRVPNVVPHPDVKDAARDAAPPGGLTVVVSKSSSSLTVRDGQALVLHAPVTTGSARDPLPLGNWQVTTVSPYPEFHYNPDLFWDADATDSPATIAPGPNGPVGVVWIDLSKPHYGIHGTPEPATIGHTSSHGCVRMTNWDAARLAALVGEGTPVRFVE